jgi:hypothetical protein
MGTAQAAHGHEPCARGTLDEPGAARELTIAVAADSAELSYRLDRNKA